jgi:hypothetical protein
MRAGEDEERHLAPFSRTYVAMPHSAAFLLAAAVCWQPLFGRLIWKKVGDFHFEGRRQGSDHQQRGVAFAPFDSADVGPVVFGAVGKLFLAPTPVEAEGPQSLTKLFLHWLHIGMKPR